MKKSIIIPHHLKVGAAVKLYNSPLRFMYIFLASIVSMEVVIMMFLGKFSFSNPWLQVVLDAFMLFVLVYPLIIYICTGP